MARTYLDYNASAPLRPVARIKMLEALECVGNPSSIHAEGRQARYFIETARGEIAALAGASPKTILFTSGATEALNLALRPDWRHPPLTRALIGATEHVAALEGHEFGENAALLQVDAFGCIDLTALEAALAGPPALVVIQAANNETGVIQPIEAIARMVRLARGLLVCDAVQAAAHMPIRFDEMLADILILSSHKIGGPKGAGALVLRDQSLQLARAALRGGGQERGYRAGTENAAAIAGFGAAAAEIRVKQGEESDKCRILRDDLERVLKDLAPEIIFFGDCAPRLPQVSAFALPDIPAETLLMALDLAGIAVSSGSACSSGKVRESHVLAAMGTPPSLAKSAIRVSFGWNSTVKDAKAFTEAFTIAINRIRSRRLAG